MPDLGVSKLSKYPTGDTGTVTNVMGGIVVSFDANTGLHISSQVAGLEANCVDCGFHIHEGYACATSGGRHRPFVGTVKHDCPPSDFTKRRELAYRHRHVNARHTIRVGGVLGEFPWVNLFFRL